MSDQLLGLIAVSIALGGPVLICIWAIIYGCYLNWQERDLWR